MGSGSSIILCPFWRIQRSHFTVKVCDNLRDGVPSCVADKFYPDLSYEEMVARMDAGLTTMPNLVICHHFVRSDVWYTSIVKRGCLFGGDVCIHSEHKSFMSCIGCSRFHV